MRCGQDGTGRWVSPGICSVPQQPSSKGEGCLKSKSGEKKNPAVEIVNGQVAGDRRFQVTQTAWKEAGLKPENCGSRSEPLRPKPPVQARGVDIGLDYYLYDYCYYYYYYNWFNITFKFQCQNSAGQLCVVPADSTLHTFCSKYVSVVKGNTLHVVLSQSFLLFLFVCFLLLQ